MQYSELDFLKNSEDLVNSCFESSVKELGIFFPREYPVVFWLRIDCLFFSCEQKKRENVVIASSSAHELMMEASGWGFNRGVNDE